MKTLVPRDELQDGFDLTDAPLGPDGLPAPLPQVERSPPRPTLCAAGPCRNYHRLEIQVEAQHPLAQRIPVQVPEGTPRTQRDGGGTVYRPLPVFHTAVHHYCYPSSGIETILDTPVVSCNRYDPIGDERSSSRIEYRRQLAAWEAGMAQVADDAAEAERVIAEAMAAHQTEPGGTPDSNKEQTP